MFETLNLFPTPVHKVKIVPTDEQFKNLDMLLTEWFDNSKEAVWALETGKSTGQKDLFLHHRPEMQWLLEATHFAACQYWIALDYAHNAQLVCPTSWANLHKPGQVTGEHSHCGGSQKAHVSAVYYFKKPADSGNIEFRDPLEYIHSLSPRNEYNDEIIPKAHTEIESDQFDLLLFPSWMKHRTQVNKSTGDRIAISLNFIGVW